MKLIIPKKEMLVKTNIEDVLEFYFKPIFNYVYRKRLKMCTKLLDGHKFNKILDAGYGTGIFFFTLNQISKGLYGIDEHEKHEEVMKKYRKYGLNLKLVSGDVSSKLPYKNNAFDCVVTISTLEHIKDLDKVMNEFYRVLEKGGCLVAGFPVKNKITAAFLKMITPFWKEKVDIVNNFHVSSHKDIILAVKKRFKIVKVLRFPFFMPLDFSSYICLKAKKT